MNKLTIVGGISLVSGLTLLTFKGISGFTGKKIDTPDLTIEQVADPQKLVWIDNLSSEFIQNIADKAVTTPLYMYCLIFGVLFLVIGGLFKE